MKTHLIIAAGNGGQEAADTARMIASMYFNWAKNHRFEVMEESPESGEHPSYRLLINGAGSCAMLCGETGVHRVVRISPYDLQKRRHTTFVSVIVSRVERDLEKALAQLHRTRLREQVVPRSQLAAGRTYMFDPVPYVKDYATNLTRHSGSGCDEPQHTLAGNLDLFLLHRLASKTGCRSEGIIVVKVRYDEVKTGDKLLVSRDSAPREKREMVVALVEVYPTRYDDMMVRITLEDGDIHYGWCDREVERL